VYNNYSIACEGCEHVHIGQTKRNLVRVQLSIKKHYFFVKNKSQRCRNMLAKPTIQMGGIIPQTGGTIKAFI